MRYRTRFFLTNVMLGFASALALMVVTFAVTLFARDLVQWVWALSP